MLIQHTNYHYILAKQTPFQNLPPFWSRGLVTSHEQTFNNLLQNQQCSVFFQQYINISVCSSLYCAGAIMSGNQLENCAHSPFFWDKLLKPYQRASSFFSEVAPSQTSSSSKGKKDHGKDLIIQDEVMSLRVQCAYFSYQALPSCFFECCGCLSSSLMGKSSADCKGCAMS